MPSLALHGLLLQVSNSWLERFVQHLWPLNKFLDKEMGHALPTSRSALRNYLACLMQRKAKRTRSKLPAVGDLGSSKAYGAHVTQGYIPCLTRARAGSKNYRLFSKKRSLNTAEMFRFMGVNPQRFEQTGVGTGRQLHQTNWQLKCLGSYKSAQFVGLSLQKIA